MAEYYESVVKASAAEPKLVANWVTVELAGALNRNNLEISRSPVSAAALAGVLRRIGDNTISGKIAKEVFEAVWNGGGEADHIIAKRGLKQITDSGAIEAIIDQILAESPEQVQQYRAGKDKVYGSFVGRIMKATQGKANPEQLNKLLKDKLK
jgi:aspartyl-tRNA(Asn)/glutamyl-tRNA(Gln) amidotransferase subunit B